MKNLFKLVLWAFMGVTVLSGCSRKFNMPAESLTRESNWKFHRADIQSTGSLAGNFRGKLDVIWEQNTDTRPSGPITISKGYLIYPGSRKKIRFYDIAGGSYAGYVRTKGRCSTGMVVMDSLGYLVDGTRNFLLHCINLLNRNTLWNRPVRDAAAGLLIVDNRLILSLTDGSVQAFDLMTGDKKWSFEAKERLLAPPSVAAEFIVQPGDQGTLFIIHTENGQEAARQKLDNPILGTSAVGNFAYLVDMPGNVFAVNYASDSIAWKSSITGPVWSAPAVDENRVYVSSNSGEVSAFTALTGEKLWQYEAQEVIKSSPIVVGEFVVFGTMSGKLYSLKALDGTLVSKREFSGAHSQAPISDGRFIYVATDDGELVCLGDANEVAALHQ